MTQKHWKHPQFGMVFAGEFPTPVGRLAWPSLITPKDPPPPKEGQPPGKPRYEITILLPKDDPKVVAFCALIDADSKEAIKYFNQGRAATIGDCMLFGKNGDGDNYDHEKYPYYKGNWVLVARNAEKTPDKDIIGGSTTEAYPRENIKGGMLGRLVVQILITAHGISYKLKCVQVKADDGVRFGGGSRDVRDLLDDLAEEDGSPNGVVEEPVVENAPAEAPKAVAPAKGNKGKAAAVNLLA